MTLKFYSPSWRRSSSTFPLDLADTSSYPNYEVDLSPRLILGLWHPIFLPSALTHLPTLRRFHIGLNVELARYYFWDAVDGFSMAFPLMVGSEGQAFMAECKKAGKEVTVWTVNDEEEMKVAVGWGVKAVLTDRVAKFVELKQEVSYHPAKLTSAHCGSLKDGFGRLVKGSLPLEFLEVLLPSSCKLLCTPR